ncbi:MAG: hypothetical protein NTY77_04370 [Elusimicrobia bacterium]|nr:hypothetical protein [Elusimicrobiota bacterium]
MISGLCAVLLALAPEAGALQKNVGGAAAEFLRLGAGARALGMGEAYSAVAEGPDAVYWNPAGLARMSRPEVSYTRSEMPAGLHADFGAVAAPVRLLRGTVAFAVTRLSQDSLDLVDASNRTLGSFAPHSEVYALAYGHKFSGGDPTDEARDYFGDKWNVPHVERPLGYEQEPWTGEISAGLSVKLISEDLGTRQAATWAVDGGGLFRPVDWHEFILAAAVRHVGGNIHFISDSEPLPAEFAGSLAYEVRLQDRWRLLPALEVDVPYAGNVYAKAGFEAEHRITSGVEAALRLGYSSRTVPDLGLVSGFAAGVGLRVQRFSFDTAFQPMGVLGQTFRLGVGWRF